MQLSLLSQQRTAELLDAAGLPRRGRRLDDVRPAAEDAEAATQIERVEELSDAYHLQVGERDVVVAYLLEITAKANGDARAARLPGNGGADGPPARPR